ncbi:MAG: cytochrome P450 [Pseudomonadota bacterium]
MSHHDVLGIDLTAQAVLDDPHPTYGRIRERHPVYWNASLKGWVVTRYDNVRAGLRDQRLSVEKLEPYAARRGETDVLSRALMDWMVFKDPPRHDVLRAAMQRAFLARDIPTLAPQIKARVDELLDPLVSRGRMELVDDFAYPLPATVISDLFGLPREEAGQLKSWSDDLGRFVLDSVDVPDRHSRAAVAMGAMVERFRALVADHRRTPRDDFTTILLRDGDALTDDEIVHTMTLVLFAGHETTTNLIASAVLTMIRNPAIYRELEETPDLLDDAVEEILRYAGPVQTVLRIATEDMVIGEKAIAEGERVFLVLNAANRDHRVFEQPDEVRLNRGRTRHVSFGPGVHFCLGAPLARLEAKLALEGLLSRVSDLELTEEHIAYRSELIIHGPKRLPIAFRPRACG